MILIVLFNLLSFFISSLDPDYKAFLESLNQDEEPPPSVEAHLEEIEAKKCNNSVLFVIVNEEFRERINCMYVKFYLLQDSSYT